MTEVDTLTPNRLASMFALRYLIGMEEMTTLQRVTRMKLLLTQLVEGEYKVDATEFTTIRAALIQDKCLAGRLPRIVTDYMTPAEFWHYIRSYSPHYKPRREHVWEQFLELIRELEASPSMPSKATTEETLKSLNSEEAQKLFAVALNRTEHDANGAVTAARSLLESTCKLLLDDMGESYSGKDTATALYSMVSKKLRLHPTQHPNDSLKRILSGCSQIVQGIADARNGMGDAHGQGRKPMNAAPRHAKLAVTVAGAMSAFLIETYNNQKKSNR